MYHLTFSMYLCLGLFYFCRFFVGFGFLEVHSMNENSLQTFFKRVRTFGHELTFGHP